MNSLKAVTDFYSVIYFYILSKCLACSRSSITIWPIGLIEFVKQFQTGVPSSWPCSMPARPDCRKRGSLLSEQVRLGLYYNRVSPVVVGQSFFRYPVFFLWLSSSANDTLFFCWGTRIPLVHFLYLKGFDKLFQWRYYPLQGHLIKVRSVYSKEFRLLMTFS